MADHLTSVKALEKLYRAWAASAQKADKPADVAKYIERGDALKAVTEELEELRRITKPIPASYGDLSDLPPELVKELAGIRVDELEQQIFTIIKTGAEQVDLDAVLIELFRRFKVVQTRKFLQNKLWRMAQKGVIHAVAGKKGVYSAASPSRPQPTFGSFGSDLDDDVPF